jgi:hypothetical protein
MDLLGRPATDVRSTVQEDFHQPDDARLVDLDAGDSAPHGRIAHLSNGKRSLHCGISIPPMSLVGHFAALPQCSIAVRCAPMS